MWDSRRLLLTQENAWEAQMAARGQRGGGGDAGWRRPQALKASLLGAESPPLRLSLEGESRVDPVSKAE